MKKNTERLEQSFLRGSSQLLKKIRLSECPVWQFHYLGAISAYCELAVDLKDCLENSTYQKLIDLEDQALAEITQRCAHQSLKH